MTAELLDEAYFVWLYKQVADPSIQDESLTYWKVLRILFKKEFVWMVPNDDNRILDGQALRLRFLEDQDIPDPDEDWMDLGCSVLEVAMGLSDRLAFMADGEPHYHFWTLMENLGLQGYNDRAHLPEEFIDEILHTLIFRRYQSNGQGGFFPLRETRKDQRKVELWNQLSEYVMEMDP